MLCCVMRVFHLQGAVLDGGTMSQQTFRFSDSFAMFVKPPVRSLIHHLPGPFQTAISIIREYRSVLGYYPHILFPRTFNEKIQVRKLFDRRRQLTEWADKYLVRDYVRRTLGPDVLPTLYHVTADPSDIPFDLLPKQYVIKATHGSGWTYIVRDGAAVNRQEIIDRCKTWLSTSYYALKKEWPYKNIIPRILIEEFLDNGTGTTPNDYKFFVFAGKVKFIQVDTNRYTDHRRDLYDTGWNRMECRYKYEHCAGKLARPENLGTMIDYAQRLAGDIDFVRVDLYGIQGKIYFGELTNTPSNGFGRFRPISWDKTFGKFWKMRILSDACRSWWVSRGSYGQVRRPVAGAGFTEQARRFQ